MSKADNTPEMTMEDILELNARQLAAEASEKVVLKIPRTSQKDDTTVYMSVNGKNYLIPRGVEVRVPRYVADEYYRSCEAMQAFYVQSDELSSRPDSISNLQ